MEIDAHKNAHHVIQRHSKGVLFWTIIEGSLLIKYTECLTQSLQKLRGDPVGGIVTAECACPRYWLLKLAGL
ncbi:unnamed protein product, partial [Linum tenue]